MELVDTILQAVLTAVGGKFPPGCGAAVGALPIVANLLNTVRNSGPERKYYLRRYFKLIRFLHKKKPSPASESPPKKKCKTSNEASEEAATDECGPTQSNRGKEIIDYKMGDKEKNPDPKTPAKQVKFRTALVSSFTGVKTSAVMKKVKSKLKSPTLPKKSLLRFPNG